MFGANDNWILRYGTSLDSEFNLLHLGNIDKFFSRAEDGRLGKV